LDRLDLTELSTVHCSPSLDIFLQALQENTTVRTVHVGPLVVEMASFATLNRLLQAIASTQGVQSIEVAQPHVNAPVPIGGKSLAALMAVVSLQSLILWPFCRLTPDEVRMTADAVRNHTSLHTVALLNVCLRQNNNNNNADGNTGSTPPQDDHEEIEEVDSTGIAPPPPVSMDPLLTALATVPQLTTLHLVSGVSVVTPTTTPVVSVTSLVHFLQHAPRSLHTLVLRNWGLTDKHGAVFVQALLQNPTQTDCSLAASLRSMDVRFNSFTTSTYQSLVSLLQTNTVLECLETDLTDSGSDDNSNNKLFQDMTWLLSLNRAGRGTFLLDDTATKQERIACLYKAHDEVSILFYLLTHNPSVCENNSKSL
jgi:hypothetical protein